MILVLGTPDSGKSSFAEKMVQDLCGDRKVAYIATMIPFDEDGIKRIEKHKRLRADKNFITYEEPFSVSELCEKFTMDNVADALLECVSNLVGNVIHKKENEDEKEEDLVNAIVDDICKLSSSLNNLFVVGNHFEISNDYDEDTCRYIRINNSVNEKLKNLSERYYLKEKEEWLSYENN